MNTSIFSTLEGMNQCHGRRHRSTQVERQWKPFGDWIPRQNGSVCGVESRMWSMGYVTALEEDVESTSCWGDVTAANGWYKRKIHHWGMSMSTTDATRKKSSGDHQVWVFSVVIFNWLHGSTGYFHRKIGYFNYCISMNRFMNWEEEMEA